MNLRMSTDIEIPEGRRSSLEGKVIYRHDLIEQNTVIAGGEKFAFDNEPQAKLLYEAATFFGPGPYRIPDNEEDARIALEDWLAHKAEIDQYFWKRARRRSDDEQFQKEMVEEFWSLYRRWRRGHEDPMAARRAPLHKIKVERVPDDQDAVIEFGPIPREKYVPPEPVEAPVPA